MLLIQNPAVDKAIKKYRDAAKWISQWRDTATLSQWQSLIDVRRSYPSADGVKNKYGVVITVFNVKGNEYRLLTVIDYTASVVYEVDLISHGQYDKNNWKEWQI